MPDLFAIDWNPFAPEAISKEIADFNHKLDKLLSNLPPQYTIAPQKIRDDIEAGKGLWPVKKLDVLEDRNIPIDIVLAALPFEEQAINRALTLLSLKISSFAHTQPKIWLYIRPSRNALEIGLILKAS